jgi:hypothetical protein
MITITQLYNAHTKYNRFLYKNTNNSENLHNYIQHTIMTTTFKTRKCTQRNDRQPQEHLS